MIRTCTWDEVRATRRQNDKATFRGFITDFIVSEPGDQPRPQAFLVEQSPNWVLPTHFHLQHQFQVITAGNGTLGRVPVGPLCVHYASPESAYGPLTAGAEGISYLTLRALSDEGAWYLPESREVMRRGIRKQQEHGKPRTDLAEDAERDLDAPAFDVLIAPQESGLAACLMRLPANHVASAPAWELSGDRFYIVTRGSMVVADKRLAALATVFVSRGEPLPVQSGSGGLEMLVLQFPDMARLEP